MFETNYYTEIDSKSWVFSKILANENSPTQAKDIVIGDVAGFNDLTVNGIMLISDNLIVEAPLSYPNLVLIPEAEAKSLYFSLFKKLPAGVLINGSDSVEMSHYLPAVDLLAKVSSNTFANKKNLYYELGYKLDLANSIIHVVQALPALPAGQNYAISFLLSVV